MACVSAGVDIPVDGVGAAGVARLASGAQLPGVPGTTIDGGVDAPAALAVTLSVPQRANTPRALIALKFKIIRFMVIPPI